MSLDIQTGTPPAQKRYFAKFSSSSGRYIGTSNDISFNSFRKTINGGLSELSLSLARPFDDFGEGEDIDFMNHVEIWIVDKESGAEGQLIYSGFIDTYEPFAGSREGVTVNCLGYVTRLAEVLYKNGTTITITHNSTDPSAMIKAIIDRYNVEDTKSRISYSASSVVSTGTAASYTFVMQNCLEAIDKARELAPSGWWWYVDENNILWFDHQHPQASHTFTFRKDVTDIRVNKNVRDVVNQVVLWNGLQAKDANFLCRSYKDNASINTYHLKTYQHTDSRVTQSATMDLWGNAFLEARKDPNVKVTMKVVDSNSNSLGYDIESINPGDTCRVLNLPTTSTVLGDNMVITSVTYQLDSVTIELEELRQKLSQKFSDVSKQQQDHLYADGPSSYTEA